MLAITVAVFAFYPSDHYIFLPDPARNVEPLVQVEGEHERPGDGGIYMVDVIVRKASLLERYFPGLLHDGDATLIPAKVYNPQNLPERIQRQQGLEEMSTSQKIAAAVALRELGYDIEVTGTGAVVRNVGSDMPAAGVLEINDTIVAIDDVPITTAGQAVDAIGAHKPGDTITMRIEPISPEGVKGEPHDEVVTLGARPDDASQALLGVSMGTRDTQFDLPVTITIDSQDVGGPSAGLALTLGIIDVMTPGSLSGGKRVAVTGTIDLDGNVGIIGGIQQKTFLASRSGITLFIVPEPEADEARKYADPGLTIVGVRTIDEALAALAENGGSVDVVEEAAAAASTTPPGSEGP